MQVTYELHVLIKDRWTIEQTYPGDQKQRALDHARELYVEPHVTAVKVISETYDEATNESRESTIFEAAPGPRKGSAAARRQAPRPAAAPQPAPAPAQRAAARPTGPPPMSTVKLAAMLLALIAAVVVLGFVVMRGSEMLSGLG